MRRAAAVGKPIVAHCEVDELLRGGYIHDGVYCREHGHKGICSESEWRQVGRDIALAEKTGCRYHVCHVSTKESVELVRRARAKGLRVSCETAPHYLLLCDEDLQEEGRFKMNPPLRSRADREAVECHIVINRVGTGNQPVISDNGHAGSLGLFNGSCGGSAVLRADDQHGNSLGDQRLNVCLLSRGRTLAEHNLIGESGITQNGLKLCLILQPSGLILGRQHNAYLNGSTRSLVGGRLRSVGGGLCTAGTTAAGQQADQQGCHAEQTNQLLFHRKPSLFLAVSI